MEYQWGRVDVPPHTRCSAVLLLWDLQAFKLLEKRGQGEGPSPISTQAKVFSLSSLFTEKDFSKTL